MTEERLAEFMECWNTRDVDKLVGFFTEDGVFHGSVGPNLLGRPRSARTPSAPRSPGSSSEAPVDASRTPRSTSPAIVEWLSGRSSPVRTPSEAAICSSSQAIGSS